jgi:hypothetical protein
MFRLFTSAIIRKAIILEAERTPSDTIEEIQAESQRLLDTDRKGLPGSVSKMQEAVGPGSTCGRELLRG